MLHSLPEALLCVLQLWQMLAVARLSWAWQPWKTQTRLALHALLDAPLLALLLQRLRLLQKLRLMMMTSPLEVHTALVQLTALVCAWLPSHAVNLVRSQCWRLVCSPRSCHALLCSLGQHFALIPAAHLSAVDPRLWELF